MICEAPTGLFKVWAVMEKTCWSKSIYLKLVLIQIYDNQSVKRGNEISPQFVRAQREEWRRSEQGVLTWRRGKDRDGSNWSPHESIVSLCSSFKLWCFLYLTLVSKRFEFHPRLSENTWFLFKLSNNDLIVLEKAGKCVNTVLPRWHHLMAESVQEVELRG